MNFDFLKSTFKIIGKLTKLQNMHFKQKPQRIRDLYNQPKYLVPRSAIHIPSFGVISSSDECWVSLYNSTMVGNTFIHLVLLLSKNSFDYMSFDCLANASITPNVRWSLSLTCSNTALKSLKTVE